MGSFINLIKSLHDSQSTTSRRRTPSHKYYGSENEGARMSYPQSEEERANQSEHEDTIMEGDTEEYESEEEVSQSEDKHIHPHRPLVAKNVSLATFYLLIRQIIFVFVFVALFAFTFFNQLYLTVNSDTTLLGWILHAIVRCLLFFSLSFLFPFTPS